MLNLCVQFGRINPSIQGRKLIGLEQLIKYVVTLSVSPKDFMGALTSTGAVGRVTSGQKLEGGNETGYLKIQLF